MGKKYKAIFASITAVWLMLSVVTAFQFRDVFPNGESDDVVVALLDTTVNERVFKHNSQIWRNMGECENGRDVDNNGVVDDLYGYNFLEDSNVVITEDWLNHGTACADVLIDTYVKMSDNNKELKLMILPVMGMQDSHTEGRVAAAIKAIKYAEEQGASICNISWSSDCDSPALRKAMKDSSMLFVVSAGNGNFYGTDIDKNFSYPASFNIDNMIVVTALSQYTNKRLSSNSNYGKNNVDVAALGTVSIKGPDGIIRCIEGTSFAAPQITALAALSVASGRNGFYSIKKDVFSLCEKNTEILDKVDNGRCFVRE